MQLLFRRFDMARIVFFIAFLGLFWGGILQSPLFAKNSPYNIDGVEVDILDESAVKARNKAFAEAQKKAFGILATYYFSTEELKTLPVPTEDVLSGLIQNFQIVNEQISTKRYKGVFDFRFKPSAVNSYFARGPINFEQPIIAEVDKVLLLPFYHEEKKSVVFNKEQNPFWESLTGDIKNFPMIVLPEGNIQDLTDIGNKNPNALTPVTIKKLKARYDVNSIMVAIAHISLQDQTLINIELMDASTGSLIPVISFDVNADMIGQKTLAVAAELVKPKPLISDSDVPQNLSEKVQIPVSEINPEPFDPDNTKGRRTLSAREKIIEMSRNREADNRHDKPKPLQRGLEVKDERQTDQFSENGEISVKVFFNSMGEWIKIQKEMSSLQGIKGIRIVTLKTNQADTVIEYNSWEQLMISMKSNGLKLDPQSADSYILKNASDNF